MKNYSNQIIKTSLLASMIAACAFVMLEPVISSAVEDQFTITQVVTAEISFSTASNDVTMNGSLAGVTGGTSNGTSTNVVYTNNSTGFTMTIVASATPAMRGFSTSASIPNYTPVTAGIPDYTFGAPAASSAEFGYTVSASSTPDLALKFKDNGSNACNTAGASADTNGTATCWYNLSTTATSTIVTSTATGASGATSSIIFKTTINNGTNQSAETYQATTTLTAVVN